MQELVVPKSMPNTLAIRVSSEIVTQSSARWVPAGGEWQNRRLPSKSA
jgi:hypothetical protein